MSALFPGIYLSHFGHFKIRGIACYQRQLMFKRGRGDDRVFDMKGTTLCVRPTPWAIRLRDGVHPRAVPRDRRASPASKMPSREHQAEDIFEQWQESRPDEDEE